MDSFHHTSRLIEALREQALLADALPVPRYLSQSDQNHSELVSRYISGDSTVGHKLRPRETLNVIDEWLGAQEVNAFTNHTRAVMFSAFLEAILEQPDWNRESPTICSAACAIMQMILDTSHKGQSALLRLFGKLLTNARELDLSSDEYLICEIVYLSIASVCGQLRADDLSDLERHGNQVLEADAEEYDEEELRRIVSLCLDLNSLPGRIHVALESIINHCCHKNARLRSQRNAE